MFFNSIHESWGSRSAPPRRRCLLDCNGASTCWPPRCPRRKRVGVAAAPRPAAASCFSPCLGCRWASSSSPPHTTAAPSERSYRTASGFSQVLRVHKTLSRAAPIARLPPCSPPHTTAAPTGHRRRTINEPSPLHTTAAPSERCCRTASGPSQVPRVHETLARAAPIARLPPYSLPHTTAAPTRRRRRTTTSPRRSSGYSKRLLAPHLFRAPIKYTKLYFAPVFFVADSPGCIERKHET